MTTEALSICLVVLIDEMERAIVEAPVETVGDTEEPDDEA